MIVIDSSAACDSAVTGLAQWHEICSIESLAWIGTNGNNVVNFFSQRDDIVL